jgi:hypothetical protein
MTIYHFRNVDANESFRLVFRPDENVESVIVRIRKELQKRNRDVEEQDQPIPTLILNGEILELNQKLSDLSLFPDEEILVQMQTAHPDKAHMMIDLIPKLQLGDNKCDRVRCYAALAASFGDLAKARKILYGDSPAAGTANGSVLVARETDRPQEVAVQRPRPPIAELLEIVGKGFDRSFVETILLQCQNDIGRAREALLEMMG